MLIRFFWQNCHLCNDDVLWVEATQAEAESHIFPRLSADDISQSRHLSKSTGHMTECMGSRPDLTFCFLVSKDLSFIRPFPVHYPIHNLWNAYSPFKKMSDTNVKSLDELCTIDLPDQQPNFYKS